MGLPLALNQYKNESSIKQLSKNKYVLQQNKRDVGFPDNRIYLLEKISSETN